MGSIKITLIDTNVLISAIIFNKRELEVIIRSHELGHRLLVSEHILEETTRVFMKKFPTHLDQLTSFLEISEIRIIPMNEYSSSIEDVKGIRDKYDAHVIACATKMKCDFIVSGDKDLLSFKNTKINILNSREYLSQI